MTMTASERRRPATAARLPLESDPTTDLMESLWAARGDQAAAGLRKAIETLDHWVRRDRSAEVGLRNAYGWSADPTALLTARHDATARCEWLEAKASGTDPGPFVHAAPTPEQFAGQILAALGPHAPARIADGCRTASALLGTMLSRIREDLGSRRRVYDGDIDLLAESWARNEAHIADLAAREAELSQRLGRLSLVPEAIESRFRSEARVTLDALGMDAITGGLARARGLDIKPEETNGTIEAAKYRLGNLTKELAGVPQSSREAVKRVLRGEIEAEIEAELGWLKSHADHQTERVASALVAEVNRASEDPAGWRVVADAIAEHPEGFPEGAGARWLGPLNASLEKIDAAILVDVAPYL